MGVIISITIFILIAIILNRSVRDDKIVLRQIEGDLSKMYQDKELHKRNVARIKKITDTRDQVCIVWIRQDTGIPLLDIRKILIDDLAFKQCLDDPRRFERAEVVREGSLCLMCVHNTFRGDFVDPGGCSLGGRWLVRGEKVCPEPDYRKPGFLEK